LFAVRRSFGERDLIERPAHSFGTTARTGLLRQPSANDLTGSGLPRIPLADPTDAKDAGMWHVGSLHPQNAQAMPVKSRRAQDSLELSKWSRKSADFMGSIPLA
jgi:hypothetical protein